MQKPYLLPKALLYPITLTYDTLSGSSVSYTSLTKLTLLQLDTQYNTSPNTLKINIIIKSLNNAEDISKLFLDDVDTLYSKILEVSTISQEDIDDVSESLLTLEDPKYSTDDFTSCKVCQDKGLDKLRNCPMIDKAQHNKHMIPYTFKGNANKLSRECPMYKVNSSTFTPAALELLLMLKLNTLPLSGGMLEQTVFVNEISRLLKPIIDKKNIPMM